MRDFPSVMRLFCKKSAFRSRSQSSEKPGSLPKKLGRRRRNLSQSRCHLKATELLSASELYTRTTGESPSGSEQLSRPPSALIAPVALRRESAEGPPETLASKGIHTSVSDDPSLSIMQYSARQNRHVRMYFALHASHVRPQPKQSRCTPTCAWSSVSMSRAGRTASGKR
jgi:hypothetical protein